MAESTALSIFQGLPRRRPASPGLNIASLGGMDIRNALGAHYFSKLHDHVQHNCRIKQQLVSERQIAELTAEIAMTHEDARHIRAESGQSIRDLISQEWCYVDDDIAELCIDMANDAANWVQVWIGMGSLDPISMPYDYEPMLTRTQDAASHYGTSHSPKRSSNRSAVQRCIDDYLDNAAVSTPD